MPVQLLPALPDHSFIFIDANIFICGLSGQSAKPHKLDAYRARSAHSSLFCLVKQDGLSRSLGLRYGYVVK